MFFLAVDDQNSYAGMGALVLGFHIPLFFPLLLTIGAVKVINSALL
jgi:hypothetical protein